jgi:hypothetical protein
LFFYKDKQNNFLFIAARSKLNFVVKDLYRFNGFRKIKLGYLNFSYLCRPDFKIHFFRKKKMNLSYIQKNSKTQAAACVRKTISARGSVFVMDNHDVATILSTPFFPRR